jgi:two-component system nitrogen regulation sensor histidine kinase GlnL|tara:strand:+ start:404 stop:1492 length:1089 start_codon:yes stop_codon:yes gene_type:complete
MMKKDNLQNLLLDSLSVSIILLDEKLTISYLNPSAENLFDASSIRIIGLPILNFLQPDQKCSLGEVVHLCSLDKALKEAQPFTQREASLQLLNSRHITTDLTASPIVWGQEKMLLLELQPIERLLQLSKENELLSTHDATRSIVRGLAHEIKNPLGGIKGAAQLLSDDLSSQPELLEFTDIISSETDRLCSLVDRLLGSNALPKLLPTNIHEVLEYIVSLTEKETLGYIEVERNYDPSIPEINGDRGQLIQALLNITRNAVQALKNSVQKTPRIWIRTRIERNFTIRGVNHRMVCCVEIINNGPDIPEEILNSIFFPMISGRPEGTGLGLSIAQSAVDAHRGLIRCETSVDKTTFYVYLPLG